MPPSSLGSRRLPAAWLLLLTTCRPASEAHSLPSRAGTDAPILRSQGSSAASSAFSAGASQAPIRAGSCEPLRVDVPAYPTVPLNPALPRIEDAGHRAMRGFFERLASLMRGRTGDHVRIAIYGDSNMTLDLISGPMRRAIQKIHGDGGHGYVAVGMPWKWYDHWDVEHSIRGPWATYTPSTVRIGDWGFGIAGVTSITRTPGAAATFSTARGDAPVGRTAGRFGVMYHVAPRGGSFDILVDGKVEATVDTREGEGATGYRVVHVPDGPHRFQIVNRGKDQVRLYGVTLEREYPGIVLDMLGIVGISYYDIARFDETINASILRQRPYDLVIYLVGLNSWMATDNPASVARLAAFHRRVHPEVSLLILSPPDHTKKATDAHSEVQFVHIAQGLHKAAIDNQCAFWDFREAMGGDGSMARFFHKNLAARDLYHFTRSGAAFMGSRLVHAIWAAFADYLAQHPLAGCASNDAGP